MDHTLHHRLPSFCNWAMEESINNNQLNALLVQLITHPGLHARFLNTLSFMELCGAQKLARLGKSITASTFWLEHVAEEYRHAFFLRSLAGKLHHHFDAYTTENTLALMASKNYIGLMDTNLCRLLKKHDLLSPEHAYVLTTLVIELRALPFYRLYQEMLDSHAVGISVKSIISEEEHHLEEIQTRLQVFQLPTALIDEAERLEKDLYQRWLHRLTHALKHAILAPAVTTNLWRPHH